MAFGTIDTTYELPPLFTETKLAAMRNRLGISTLDLINRVRGGLAAVNTKSQIVTEFTVDTTQDRVEARRGTKKVWQRGAEYTIARPQRGHAQSGWLLPLNTYEIGLGFTAEGLAKIDVESFDRELSDTLTAVRRGQDADVLYRLYSRDEMPLDDDGTGASPGFAGSGTGTNVFTGTTLKGTTVDSTYTHYAHTTAEAAAAKTALDALIEKMKLWTNATLEIIPTDQFLDLLMAMRENNEFVPTGSTFLIPADNEVRTAVSADRYAGVYKGTVLVRKAITGVEGNNAILIDPTVKPLFWRYDTLDGRNARVVDRDIYPLVNANIRQTYGIGVANRTSVALLSLGSGSEYTAPTIVY